MAIQRLTACPVVSVFASTVGTKLTRMERATFTQHRKVNVDELLEVVTRAYKYQRVNPAVLVGTNSVFRQLEDRQRCFRQNEGNN